MIRDLLQTIGSGYTVIEESAIAQFGSTHILRANDDYFVATIYGKELSEGIQNPDQFFASIETAIYNTAAGASRIRAGRLPVPDGRLFLVSGPFHQPLQTAHFRLTQSPLSAAEASQTGATLCSVLQQVHEAGHIHGALTPGSVILGAQGGVWLTETGVSKILEDLGLRTTELPVALQSRYLAPEQVSGGPVDQRADIYSAGAILYELVTGKPPFGGRTTATVMANILTDEAALNKSADSDHVIDAILRAIEKDPEDRWSSARQFGTALNEQTQGVTPVALEKQKSGCLSIIVGALGTGAYLLHQVLG